MHKATHILLTFTLLFSLTLVSYAAEQITEDIDNPDELFLDDAILAEALTGVVADVNTETGIITVTSDEDGQDVKFNISPHCYILIDDLDAEAVDVKLGDTIYLEYYYEDHQNITDWIEITREVPAEAPQVE